jgi:hypothetical protein
METMEVKKPVIEPKEINLLDERKQIVQSVVDRVIQYGDEYKNALRKLNDKFPNKLEKTWLSPISDK